MTFEECDRCLEKDRCHLPTETVDESLRTKKYCEITKRKLRINAWNKRVEVSYE